MAIPKKIPKFLWPLFHNYVPESIDPVRNWKFVIKTVMVTGTWEQVEWVAQTYGRDRFEQVVREDLEGNRELPRPVANFWSIALWGKLLPPLQKGERWKPTRKIPGV
ncbi:MAG TPA: hypothetical protein GX517_01525 [Alicyclobacillus sp.]|nr:hypothetical protein [Alicyclobacillus sp.]